MRVLLLFCAAAAINCRARALSRAYACAAALVRCGAAHGASLLTLRALVLVLALVRVAPRQDSCVSARTSAAAHCASPLPSRVLSRAHAFGRVLPISQDSCETDNVFGELYVLGVALLVAGVGLVLVYFIREVVDGFEIKVARSSCTRPCPPLLHPLLPLSHHAAPLLPSAPAQPRSRPLLLLSHEARRCCSRPCPAPLSHPLLHSCTAPALAPALAFRKSAPLLSPVLIALAPVSHLPSPATARALAHARARSLAPFSYCSRSRSMY